ncbi:MULTISPECIES: copper resistance protein CopC [Corynebacterium]|uniref:copper resistance CopC family protein n=1 Tax=Corynebacterium TaxID=1716 RepID=UPI001CE48D9C|nr:MULTISPECIES: copper resistance protein CopC [Corynebacterium]
MKKRSITLALSTITTAGLLGMGPAFAHDSVVSSNPSANSHVTKLPDTLELTFSGEPQDGFNTIALSRNGQVLTQGEPTSDGRVLSLPLGNDVSEEPGTYTVGYQITSSDGHATRGSFEFTLDSKDSSGSDAASETEAAKEGEISGDTTRGVPTWLLPVGGIVVIGAALIMAIARWRGLKDD